MYVGTTVLLLVSASGAMESSLGLFHTFSDSQNLFISETMGPLEASQFSGQCSYGCSGTTSAGKGSFPWTTGVLGLLNGWLPLSVPQNLARAKELQKF